MESFLPLSGFQLPFQQRLSRLYNDTKKSSDFVKEPVQHEEDPEVKALHRKLRIQKDRLVSWGIEWSDASQSTEMDESLSKAGLSEVVGSIMSTIKDILAEAEPLWLSFKQLNEANRSAKDRKPPLRHWDKSRFEDLIRDLTSSIDTLFDLSRTRSMGAYQRRPSKTPYKSSASVDELRPFESSRMQTPQLIRPDSLTHLRPKHETNGQMMREVVLMSKTAYSELTHDTTREPWAPLLLEYATFDSIYSVTGIMPPMSRFEKISGGLQEHSRRSPDAWTGLPRLLGYFEDMENSRFGLVYRFPSSFSAVSFERANQNPMYNLPTLGQLLEQPNSEPKLEAKFRLAHNLSNTVFDLHTRGITHGNLTPVNVSFSDTVASGPHVTSGAVDVRRPLVSSFDVFSDDTATSGQALSRHALDPRVNRNSSLPKSTDERIFELYSLGMLLLSIGLWSTLDHLVQEGTATLELGACFDKLATKCGSLYTKAVQACLSAVDLESAGECTGESLLGNVQVRTTRYLEACCILDGVSGFEERLTRELHESDPAEPAQTPARKASMVKEPSADTTRDLRDVKSPTPFVTETSQPSLVPDTQSRARTEIDDMESEDVLARQGSKAEKTKLYPHIPLPPEAVDKWNTILMPQINHALRHFYRKHPESVEISLESVGPSPAHTKPTVLVVCTSVGKVRAILKKRVGELFDASTGFSLKVCRGHVLRSRRQPGSVVRSMANPLEGAQGKIAVREDDVDAVNPQYQERPCNGASIGAWIGDRHLPPVSFGGLVMVDNKTYGMTVHHMLDDPDRDSAQEDTLRCSAIPDRDWFAQSVAESSADDDEFAYELSDTESEPYSESDITSDWGDDDDEDEFEPGDVPGIEPGCGDGYVVTQPALDDVEDGFYPSPETEDEDHLVTFSLGEVYASSGIRRKEVKGLIHEVDWALFEFTEDRVPDDNDMPYAQVPMVTKDGKKSTLCPTAVAPTTSLPGMEVQCMARTSGLQTGLIMPALTSVKIYGRTSPSHTYQISSSVTSDESIEAGPTIPMGIPGDSGAWIVERENGQLCGHVLAWSQRKRVAYICPMEVLFQDIVQTLEASDIRLPGGSPVASVMKSSDQKQAMGTYADASDDSDMDEEQQSDDEMAPALVTSAMFSKTTSSHSLESMTSRTGSDRGAGSPIRINSAGEIGGLSRSINNMRLGRGIGVSG
jgi:hypothetical protein